MLYMYNWITVLCTWIIKSTILQQNIYIKKKKKMDTAQMIYDTFRFFAIIYVLQVHIDILVNAQINSWKKMYQTGKS